MGTARGVSATARPLHVLLPPLCSRPCLVFLAHPYSSCCSQHGGCFFQEALSHPSPAPRMLPVTADMTAFRTSILLTRLRPPPGQELCLRVASRIPAPNGPVGGARRQPLSTPGMRE